MAEGLPARLSPKGNGGPIVNVGALPWIDPEAAETVTVPCFKVVIRPLPLIVARAGSDVDQVSPVRDLALPSEKLPVALNCSVRPAAKDEDGDATVMDCRVGGGGVTMDEPPPPPQPVTKTTQQSIMSG